MSKPTHENFTFRIPIETKRWLADYSAKHNTSSSKVVRELIIALHQGLHVGRIDFNGYRRIDIGPNSVVVLPEKNVKAQLEQAMKVVEVLGLK